MKTNGICTYSHRTPTTITFVRRGKNLTGNNHAIATLRSATRQWGNLADIALADKGVFEEKHLPRFAMMCHNIGYDVVVRDVK